MPLRQCIVTVITEDEAKDHPQAILARMQRDYTAAGPKSIDIGGRVSRKTVLRDLAALPTDLLARVHAVAMRLVEERKEGEEETSP